MVLNGDRLLGTTCWREPHYFSWAPREVKEILKQFGDDPLEFGEFNSERPTSKADNALARMFLMSVERWTFVVFDISLIQPAGVPDVLE